MTPRYFPLSVSISLVLFLACWAGAAQGQKASAPLKLVIALGPGKGPLGAFQKYIEANYQVKCYWIEAHKSKQAKGAEKNVVTPFTGIEALDDCDVILSNLYRTWAPPEQLSILKKRFLSKPVVGLRKAHHGFQNWLEAHQDVFGVDYKGHYGIEDGGVRILDEHKKNPLFANLKPFLPSGGCYMHRDVAPDVVAYMVGGPIGKDEALQTWSRIVKERNGQRVFYTRYDPKDLEDAGVRQMVTRAIFWAAQRDEAKMKQ